MAARLPVRLLRRLGLARLVRLGVAAALPPLWLEIAVLHFRGSFHSRFMWAPVLGLPLVFAGDVLCALLGDEPRERAVTRPLAWLVAGIGIAGTLFHVRGVGRQMGGFANGRYNVVTGPPFPAPMQVALVGLLGAVASAPPTAGEVGRLVRWLRAVNAASYVLLAIEAGYHHWLGGYFNRLMYVPVVLSPLLTLVHLAALVRRETATRLEGPLSALATAVGLVGFGFHVRNIGRRSGGFSWQNLFYGPPAMAPLQMTGQGALGLLVAAFRGRP
jgi:hypothetical protein